MDKSTARKLILWFVTLLFLLACELPVLSAPASSDAEPLSLETVIAGTVAAARTQTAILLPPPTNTPTITPPPTRTPTETPTPTETVIFILPTSTKPFQAYDAGSGCKAVSMEPHNPVLAPRTKFETSWTLQNTGNELWLDLNIDFKHSGGTDMHKIDVYDLPKSVAPDDQVTITVPMTAPKNPGTYTSIWVLATNKNTLCKVSVTITVK